MGLLVRLRGPIGAFLSAVWLIGCSQGTPHAESRSTEPAKTKVDLSPFPTATDLLSAKAEALKVRFPESASSWTFQTSVDPAGRGCEMVISYPAKRPKDGDHGARIIYEAKVSYMWLEDSQTWAFNELVQTRGASFIELGTPFVTLVSLEDLKGALERTTDAEPSAAADGGAR